MTNVLQPAVKVMEIGVNMIKVLSWTLAILGFLVIMGVAGNDCDGKCMENSLTLVDMLVYTVCGMSLMGLGIYLGVKYDR